MAFFNPLTKYLAIKIVYYGPGLSGKTTNLKYIYRKLDESSRGELVLLETNVQRTFFFDLLPVRVGKIDIFNTHLQLFTVPGQVFHEEARKVILKGVDGIVFVADSQLPLLDANIENYNKLKEDLLDYGLDIYKIPIVFQYNKRDLKNLIPVETFNTVLNDQKAPYIEASALEGWGVLETLKEIGSLVIPPLISKYSEEYKKTRIEEQFYPGKKETVIFSQKEKTGEFVPIKKVKLKSDEELEKEIESLIKEYAPELAKKKNE
jgi:hypothetical protein